MTDLLASDEAAARIAAKAYLDNLQKELREMAKWPRPALLYIRSLLEERDAAQAEARAARREVDHTRDWYGVRLERLMVWAREHQHEPFFDEVFAIVANGTASPTEPPRYAQLLAIARHDIERLERELAACQAK